MSRKPERTVRQRYADYRKTFPVKVNARRGELIDKMYSGFSPEEATRIFAGNPEWETEFERRRHDNLTAAEHAEMVECTRIVDEWQAASPWAKDVAKFIDKKEADAQSALAKPIPNDTP